MVTMNLLRIMADLSFYYSYAGFFADRFGANLIILGFVIQCVCYSVSSLFTKNKPLRLAVLLPMVLCFVLPQATLADRLFFLPSTAYIIVMAVTENYDLSWTRHTEMLSIYWKICIPFSLFMIVAHYPEGIYSVTLPMAIVMGTSSILLMRSLRHEPEVYLQKSYQLVNLGAVAALGLVAFLMSSNFFIKGCVAVLKFLNDYVLYPILIAILYGSTYILRGVFWFLSLIELKPRDEEDAIQVSTESVGEMLGVERIDGSSGDLAKKIFLVIFIIVVIIVLIRIFKWMARKDDRNKGFASVGEVRSEINEAPKIVHKRQDSTNTQRIRTVYRKFLKFCTEHGVHLEKSDTSMDVNRKAVIAMGETAGADELREIYIRARYDGSADKKDVSRAKELLTSIKHGENDD